MGVSNYRTGRGGGAIIFNVIGSCTFNTTSTAIVANGGWQGGGGGSVNGTCASFHGSSSINLINANGSNYMDYFTNDRGASGGGCIRLKSTGDETTFSGGFTFPNDTTTFNNFMTAFMHTEETEKIQVAVLGKEDTEVLDPYF